MAISFPSEEWIKALKDALNASETYERSAKDWEGNFIFVVEPDDTYPTYAYCFLGLYHGKSTEAALLQSLDERKAEFVITAPFGVWRQVIEGKLDPIQGMMTRKLKLSGDMMKVMRYPKAAKEIVACCAKVPTDFGQ